MLSIGLNLWRPALLGGASTSAIISALSPSGWFGTWPNVDQVTQNDIDAELLTVTRNGYNAAAQPVQFNDTLQVLGRLRQPYPNEAQPSVDSIVLSEKVYAGEVIVEGTTNNSTFAYPVPQAAWLHHDRQHVEGATFTAKLAVAHAEARNGRPVAAVKFIINDGVNPPVEQLVSTQTKTLFPASGLSVPHFEATLNVEGLAQGAMATLDAIIYPWVGEAFQLSVDGHTVPKLYASTQKILIDSANTYGKAYAYVATGATSGAASADPMAARATPYPTFAAAVLGVRAFINANYTRGPRGSGGFVRLEAGTHLFSNIRYTSVIEDVPLVIEAADPGLISTTILQGKATSGSTSIPPVLKFRNLTIKKGGGTGGNFTEYDSAAASREVENMIVFENCVFDLNGFQPTKTFIWRTGRSWFIGCSGDYCQQADIFSSGKVVATIGCAPNTIGDSPPDLVLACRDIGVRLNYLAATYLRDGAFVGWNYISTDRPGFPAIFCNCEINEYGFAVTGNIFEGYNGYGGALASFMGDGSTEPAQNVNFFNNTLVGGRANFMYNDVGTTAIERTGVYKGNIAHNFNVKSDTFTNNGNTIGNWQILMKTSVAYNSHTVGAANEIPFGPLSWMGPWAGVGEVAGSLAAPLNGNWVYDASSFFGDNSGDGIYVPQAPNDLAVIPPEALTQSFDLYGRPTSLDGIAYSGAAAPTASSAIAAAIAASTNDATYIDTTDTAKMTANSDGSGGVPADGGAVGRILAKYGNVPVIQSVAASRPARLASLGLLSSVAPANVGGFMRMDGLTLSANMMFSCVIGNTLDGEWFCLADQSNNYAGWFSGNATSSPDGGLGTCTYLVDGVDVSANRKLGRDAVQQADGANNGRHVLQITNLNLSAVTALTILRRTTQGFDGNHGHYVLCDTPDAAGIAAIREELLAKITA